MKASLISIFCLVLTATQAQAQAVEMKYGLPLPPVGATVQSVCGPKDDLQHVEFYKPALPDAVDRKFVDDHEPSTVQFQWLSEDVIRTTLPDHSPGNVGGSRWCSGTRISEKLVITAGHCFDIAKGGADYWVTPYKNGPGGGVYAKPEILARLMQVHFEYQLNVGTGAPRTPKSFPVAKLSEYRLAGLDYAIVELGPDKDGKLPGAEFKPVKTLDRDPGSTEKIAVIQHPNGDPKKVDDGKVAKVIGTAVEYGDLDTHPASSGSGIRSMTGDLVGVHTHGGCTPASGANSGVTTKAIMAASALL